MTADASETHAGERRSETDVLPEPNAILVGAEWMGRSLERVRFTRHLDSPLKLQAGNRYEHFRPTPRRMTVDGRELRVFEWAAYTTIAE